MKWHGAYILNTASRNQRIHPNGRHQRPRRGAPDGAHWTALNRSPGTGARPGDQHYQPAKLITAAITTHGSRANPTTLTGTGVDLTARAYGYKGTSACRGKRKRADGYRRQLRRYRRFGRHRIGACRLHLGSVTADLRPADSTVIVPSNHRSTCPALQSCTTR